MPGAATPPFPPAKSLILNTLLSDTLTGRFGKPVEKSEKQVVLIAAKRVNDRTDCDLDARWTTMLTSLACCKQ